MVTFYRNKNSSISYKMKRLYKHKYLKTPRNLTSTFTSSSTIGINTESNIPSDDISKTYYYDQKLEDNDSMKHFKAYTQSTITHKNNDCRRICKLLSYTYFIKTKKQIRSSRKVKENIIK